LPAHVKHFSPWFVSGPFTLYLTYWIVIFPVGFGCSIFTRKWPCSVCCSQTSWSTNQVCYSSCNGNNCIIELSCRRRATGTVSNKPIHLVLLAQVALPTPCLNYTPTTRRVSECTHPFYPPFHLLNATSYIATPSLFSFFPCPSLHRFSSFISQPKLSASFQNELKGLTSFESVYTDVYIFSYKLVIQSNWV
jgi:hypothetical protein